MSIGYVCLNIGTPGTKMRSVMQRNANAEKLTEVTAQNLAALEKLIDYNRENNIKLFRISSNLIPFGFSPINRLPWWDIHQEAFQSIGAKIGESGMRVSFHPGQYTVLNSPYKDVVARAIMDLDYHSKMLDCLGVGNAHKIILHVGGTYGDKEAAMERFAMNFRRLSEPVKHRLVIKNDDRLYTIADVLTLAQQLGIPAVFDNLHHAINPPPAEGTESYWILEVGKTWKKDDGKQKIHYSQQAPGKRPSTHTDTIHLDTFLTFHENLEDKQIDIMLEGKVKNLSAVKCVNATSLGNKLSMLEKEWGRYKYTILEKSSADYQAVRTLLKDKTAYPITEFYRLIDYALAKETLPGAAENAALHVWGYFKSEATEKEKSQFQKNLENYRNSTVSLATVKRQLLKLAKKYEEAYLLQSLYFYLD